MEEVTDAGLEGQFRVAVFGVTDKLKVKFRLMKFPFVSFAWMVGCEVKFTPFCAVPGTLPMVIEANGPALTLKVARQSESKVVDPE